MVPRPGPRPAGFTILELLFTLAIAGTLAATAVPQGLRTLDDFRTRSAARYLAARLADARIRAIRRSSAAGLRFQPASPDYLVTAVADGNGNGLRSAEIAGGIDPVRGPRVRLADAFAGVRFAIVDDVPAVDGGPSMLAAGTDPVRLGSSILAFAPTGSATSGTLYLASADRRQFAVRILGATGRVRTFEFDRATARWVPR